MKRGSADLEQAGKTAIVLCAATGPVAVFAVADTVRPESLAAVAALKALQVEPVMLTGDNPATARAIADQLGIQDARGNLMPEDKQGAVAELNDRHGAVGMVGDGVNDAPALARADHRLRDGRRRHRDRTGNRRCRHHG